MVDRADAGRKPEPFGGVHRDRGIEHHHHRGHVSMFVALLVLGNLVGRSRKCIEFAARQCGRYADHRDIGPDRDRVYYLAIVGDIGPQRLEILDRADVVLDQEADDLGRIGGRATADRDNEIGPDVAGSIGSFEHIGARCMGGDAAVGAGMARTQRFFDFGDFVGLLAKRRRRQQEHLLASHSLCLVQQGVGGGHAHRDALGSRKT